MPVANDKLGGIGEDKNIIVAGNEEKIKTGAEDVQKLRLFSIHEATKRNHRIFGSQA